MNRTRAKLVKGAQRKPEAEKADGGKMDPRAALLAELEEIRREVKGAHSTLNHAEKRINRLREQIASGYN